MTSESRQRSHRRLVVLAAVFFAFSLILVGRIIYWQVVRRQELLELAELEHYQTKVIPPQRGAILDRTGSLLATDIFQYEIFATPRDVPNPRWTAEQLAPLLERPPETLWALLDRKDLSVTLAKQIPLNVGEEIASRGLSGVGAIPLPQRIYPEKELACHLLGFVGAEGDGFYGLEEYYDDILQGEPGSRGGERDPSGLQMIAGYGSYVPAQEGPTLVLTLDRVIQGLVEEDLEKAIEEYGAQGGTIIVMDPWTGAILAMASYPRYDPNRFYETSQELFVNPAISEVYEPGSVFKPVTIGAALDSGEVTPETTYNDTGSILVGGQVIANWDWGARGETTVSELLRYSLNVGAATMSTKIGAEKFYRYVRRFGFGEPTGVDLAGEVSGIVKTPGDAQWHESDLGTNAFGQGISATPLQMINAMAAIANGGLLMKPYVVQRIIREDSVVEIEPVVRRRVISPETARQLTQILAEGVKEGVAELAYVEGYSIAAKTGTAQIPIPGGYDPTWTIASIVGWAPADNPRFVILVKIDKPQAAPWGAVVAAPVFKSLAQQLFDYLGIPPDEVRLARE
ncbi:MAG: peptidoglycan D,D-transpeptidase FtsI family protein [Anaerolineae bacterium]